MKYIIVTHQPILPDQPIEVDISDPPTDRFARLWALAELPLTVYTEEEWKQLQQLKNLGGERGT